MPNVVGSTPGRGRSRNSEALLMPKPFPSLCPTTNLVPFRWPGTVQGQLYSQKSPLHPNANHTNMCTHRTASVHATVLRALSRPLPHRISFQRWEN